MAKKTKKSAYFVGSAGLDFGVDEKTTSSKSRKEEKSNSGKKSKQKSNEELEFEKLFKDWKEGQRYNKEQLAFFERLILRKMKEVQKNIENFRANIIPANDLTGDDRKKQTVENNAYLQKIANHEKHKMNLQRAIVRIHTKRYGICKVSKKIIPPGRLWAVPVTTTLLEYQPK